jgi:hypothetical protein
LRNHPQLHEAFAIPNFLDEGGKTYYYLTEDEKLRVGDQVQVPVGKDKHICVETIVKIEYFTNNEAPFAPDKMKWIIGKTARPCHIPVIKTIM